MPSPRRVQPNKRAASDQDSVDADTMNCPNDSSGAEFSDGSHNNGGAETGRVGPRQARAHVQGHHQAQGQARHHGHHHGYGHRQPHSPRGGAGFGANAWTGRAPFQQDGHLRRAQVEDPWVLVAVAALALLFSALFFILVVSVR